MLQPDDISTGSLVRLACGSCKMSVESVYADDDGEDVADVMFFVDGKGIERDTVPLKHLVKPRNTNEESV